MNKFILSIGFSCLILTGGCVSVPALNSNRPIDPTDDTAAFGFYEISSFDIYTDNDSVHLLLAGKKSAHDKQSKLAYSRSEDGGRTWHEVSLLDTFPPPIASRGNDVQIAAKDGHLLAVWQTSGELPGMGPLASAYSDDAGLTWTARANPAANSAGDQSHHDLAAASNGDFHIVWLEDPEENGYQSLRYARSGDNGMTWNKPLTLDDSTCSCCWNSLRSLPDGHLAVLYRDMKPRDMALLQSKDNGATWQRTGTVGAFGWQFDGCPHVGGSFAQTGTGNAIRFESLVWTGLEAKAGLYYLKSDDGGHQWTQPIKIGNNAMHGDIAWQDHQTIAVWDEMEPEGTALFYSVNGNDRQGLSAPKHLTPAENSATHPRLATTRYGVMAMWTEKPAKQPGRLVWRMLK